MEEEAVLSRERCREIARRVARMSRGPGKVGTMIRSVAWGSIRWAANRVVTGGDARDVTIRVTRTHLTAGGTARTSRTDDGGLEAAVRWAEAEMRSRAAYRDWDLPPAGGDYAAPQVWSRETALVSPADRGAVVRTLIAEAEAARLISAGSVVTGQMSEAVFDAEGRESYCVRTIAQCAITARDPGGRGSGWAGAASHDWGALDTAGIARRAHDKCMASRAPVTIEPGRYTVILEPQAVGDLLDTVIESLDRQPAEMGMGPFADRRQPGSSRLGQPVFDQRITLHSDPSDPQLAGCPFDRRGEPYRPVRWVERGILTALAYDRGYAVENLREAAALPSSRAVRMSGGESTLEDMIRATGRGLLVTRFSHVQLLDPHSLLCTGLTRDGLWLVQNGQVTRPVTNLRFTDSPMLLLNSVESFGRPEAVFRLERAVDEEGQPLADRPAFLPHLPTIVPPLKARGFTFTRVADAV